MLGDAPFAATPFAALSGGVAFGRVVTVNARATEAVASLVIFPASISENATATEAVSVAPSTFNTGVSEFSSGLATSSALVVYPANVSESATGTEVVHVDPSTFNAVTTQTATAQDQVLASAVFICVASAGALAVDEIIARLLWEVINDSQNANWQNISNAESAGWGVISDPQNAGWTSIKTQS